MSHAAGKHKVLVIDRILGYEWEEIVDMQIGRYERPLIASGPGDYGADPIGDGMFRMVPSGDVVDSAERERRLMK